jgi:tRNA(Arg) A34 adenosine deaminase TadA
MKTYLAAAVVYRGKVITRGNNQKKSHPIQQQFAKKPEAIFLHAEVDALYKASKVLTPKQLAKATLYIARKKHPRPRTRELVWGLSKPCKGCQKAIEHYKIKEVVYTTDEGTYKYL